jgi:hypothetical protein
MNIFYFDSMLIAPRNAVGGSANLCACDPVLDL